MQPLSAPPGVKMAPEPDERQGRPDVPFSPFNPSAGVDLAEAFSSRAADLERQNAGEEPAEPDAQAAGAAPGGALADELRIPAAPADADVTQAPGESGERRAEPLVFTRTAPRPIPGAQPSAPSAPSFASRSSSFNPQGSDCAPRLMADKVNRPGEGAEGDEPVSSGRARGRLARLVFWRSASAKGADEASEASKAGAARARPRTAMARSLRPKQAKPARRDPAPSRVAYRLHRLWLRPAFRRLVKQGVPLFFLLGLIAGYLGQADNRDRIWATLADLRQAVEERPQFQVRAMQITGASQSIAQDIREILAVDFPVSTFDLDLKGMKARVSELGAVRQVAVRIQPGGVLRIDVQERQPAVVWRVGNDLELLDETGHRVAEIGARAERGDLPLLAGAGADLVVPEALALLRAAAPVRARIRGLVRVGERRWDLVLDRNQRIMLPEKGALAALEQVMAMAEAQDVLERDIVAVDMRNVHRPTIRLRVADSEKLNVINEIRPGVNGE